MPNNTRVILLVEDNPDDVAHIKYLVSKMKDRKHEYSLKVAYDGAQAFQIYQTLEVDCILIDYNMPLMSGVAVAKSLAILESSKNEMGVVPMMIMSGLQDDSVKDAMDEHMNVAYTNKGDIKTSEDMFRLVDGMIGA